MRPVPLHPAPEEPKAFLKWCKESIIAISRASQIDTSVTKDKQNAGKFLAKSANLSDVAAASTSFDNIKQDATESYKGVVELATDAETVTGTDDTRATHPKGVKAAIDAAVTALKGGVDTAFDTLKKLADGLSGKLTKTDNLSDVADAPTAFDNIKQAATATEPGVLVSKQVVFGSWLIEYPDEKWYVVIINSPLQFVIEKVTTLTSAGTATVEIEIDADPLGGGPNSASTVQSTVFHSSDNVLQKGQALIIHVSNVDGAEGLTVTIAGTMELATS